MNSGNATLVDIERLAMAGTILVGGKLEFSVADGQGIVYVNSESTNQIVVLDLARSRRISLQGCLEPTGLALDAADGLLIAACGNKVAKIIRTADGAEVASLAIGEGADAIIYDATRKLAFVPCGESGTLVVLDLTDVQRIRVAQTVATEIGARTGAVDPASGIVYLPTGNLADHPAEPLAVPDARDV